MMAWIFRLWELSRSPSSPLTWKGLPPCDIISISQNIFHRLLYCAKSTFASCIFFFQLLRCPVPGTPFVLRCAPEGVIPLDYQVSSAPWLRVARWPAGWSRMAWGNIKGGRLPPRHRYSEKEVNWKANPFGKSVKIWGGAPLIRWWSRWFGCWRDGWFLKAPGGKLRARVLNTSPQIHTSLHFLSKWITDLWYWGSLFLEENRDSPYVSIGRESRGCSRRTS